MIDGASYGMRFEPIRITVHRGDTVRFVQAGGMPHNVEFKSMPQGTTLGPQRMGPLLTKRGETYEVVIDRRFAVGKHFYVCTPHEVLGMAGIIHIAERPSSGRTLPLPPGRWRSRPSAWSPTQLRSCRMALLRRVNRKSRA